MNNRLRVSVDDIDISHSRTEYALPRAGSSSPIRTPGSRSSARRGGFGDSGTLGSNGELPEASVLYVESEAVLTEELRAITDSLRSDVQWDTRVMAMLKLEGVIKGGAADQYPAFADLVLCLQVGLATQLQDRRSAVSRQACHVISVVVQSCRLKVEPLAVGLFPVLLKVPAMGIQVVNEAAEACVRTIIRRCPSHRLLPSLCTMIKADKNAKLRQSAADYLAQVLQEWLPAEYDRQTVAIEAAILAACADSGAETRAAGKAAFAAYFAKRPAEAQAMVQLLPNTERALRDRLMATIDAAQGAGAFESDGVIVITKRPAHSRKPSDASSGCPSPSAPPTLMKRGAVRVPKLSLPSPKLKEAERPGVASARGPEASPTRQGLPPRPASASARASPASARAIAPSRVPVTAPKPEEHAPPARPVMRPGAQRKSLGGAALRVAAASSLQEDPESATKAGHSSSHATREAAPSPAARAMPAPRRERSAATDLDAAPMPLHESVGLLSRSGVLWSTKVELYESIQANMELGAGRDAVEDPELTKRLVTVLLEGAGDAHFKVATAALQAIVAVLRSRHGRPIMGLYIDALVPSLFGRVADAKEQIRHLVGEAVAMLPQIFEADLVTQGLAAAMHTARAPKILCAIMNFFAELVECCPVGKRNTAFSSGGRSLLASCIALATNKNPDVRQCALTALASVYTRASPALVDSSLAALPISPQQAVSRALAHTLQDHAPAGLREPTVSPGLPPPPRAVSTSPGRVLLRRSDLFSPDISPTSEIATIHVGEFNRSYNPSSTPAQSESVSFMVADSPGGSMMSVSLDDKTGKLEVVNPKSVTIEVDATFGVQAGMASPSSFPSSPAKRSSVPNWSLPGVLSALQGQPTAETMERAAHLAPKLRNADDVKALALAVAEALSRVFNADEASADPRLQEASMDAFSSLAAELPLDDVARLAPSLLEGLIHAAASDREAVAYAAERAAEELMQRVDAVEALSMLIPLLPAAEARPPFDGAKAKEAGLVLRLLHAAAGRVSSTQLSAVMDMVMPSLCTCYTSPNASIRKGTVSCIVSFHKTMGPDIMDPYLQSLSLAQQKLISIYVEKASVCV